MPSNWVDGCISSCHLAPSLLDVCYFFLHWLFCSLWLSSIITVCQKILNKFSPLQCFHCHMYKMSTQYVLFSSYFLLQSGCYSEVCYCANHSYQYFCPDSATVKSLHTVLCDSHTAILSFQRQLLYICCRVGYVRHFTYLHFLLLICAIRELFRI